MMIRFTKGIGKPDVLTCIRDDGSSTWSPLHNAKHDFGHYAVESTLGWQEAFFGLLAQGWDIADFGCPDAATGRKPAVPVQALQAEVLAGLLDIQRLSDFALTFVDLADLFACACHGLNVTLPALSPVQWEDIQTCLSDLLLCWHGTPPGQTFGVFWKGNFDGA